MAQPSEPRDTLVAIGEAIRLHMLYVLEGQAGGIAAKYPLNRQKSTLLKSITTEVIQGRDKASGRFEGFTPNMKLLTYAKFYAEYLDKGRRPGGKKIPIVAILQFIKNRNIRGKDKKSKKFITSNQLAWMIQNSIYKKGIRGRNFIQPALDEGQRLVELYLNDKFLDDVTYELNQYLIAI